MRQTAPNFVLFIVLTVAAGALFWAGEKYVWPPKPVEVPPRQPSKAELNVALGGGGATATLPKKIDAPKPIEIKPSEPRALIALGDESYFLKVLLTNKGGGVQQVVLTQFDEANRLGLEEKNAEGKPRPLHLIPGYKRPWSPYLAEEPAYVPLAANLSDPKAKPTKFEFDERMLSAPSYVMLHYPSRDDPARRRGEDGNVVSDDDYYPLPDLGDRTWNVASIEPGKVVFETELPAPYYLKLRKTFTLSAKDYDFKLNIDIEPLPGRARGVGAFRYQLLGPLGMPIEGEWYTSTYRNAYVGWNDAGGHARRAVEDPNSIHYKAGSDKIPRGGVFKYAGVGTQYFASVMAPDGEYSEQNQPWEYVRATREYTPSDAKIDGVEYESEKVFLYDLSVRAVSTLLDPAAGESIRHNYLVYNGPMKVRLLKQLQGPREVNPELVDTYLDKYQLVTLSDYHSPHFFGRLANAIYWADIVIFTTNLMHGLLGFLHSLVGSWGFSIMLTTVLVKLCLIIPSRRQQAINANMQARIATIKPQLDEINAKYKDDFMKLSQEKAILFRKAGIRHSAQMGGCLLLFAQMPILMGLYFCLQESIFFRLEPFLWMPNLAAPDMTKWWGEHIPMLSQPLTNCIFFTGGRFGGLSFLYLGPYFNLLPLFAVILFYVQQKLTMPPPTDEMQETQQKMMKYMLGFSALFFYKVAAGLCVYFIVSGLWSLLERKLVPKPKIDEDGIRRSIDDGPKDDQPKGWLARKAMEMKERMEEMQKQAENSRQIRNDPKPNEPQSRNERRAMKKKKK